MGFNLLLMLVYPTFIAPLFNKFKPLDDPTLKERVTALMKRCGFAAKGLFVMDGSTRSAHANAYFTGFGASKRVVFYDTLLRQLNAGEVEAVLAHELGHFKHRHIVKRHGRDVRPEPGWLRAAGLGVGARSGSTRAWACSPTWRRPTTRWRCCCSCWPCRCSASSWRRCRHWLSRKHEFEADAYAVAQTSGADLSAALLKLYQDNASTLTPDPVFVKFYYSHPPASERLARMARRPDPFGEAAS